MCSTILELNMYQRLEDKKKKNEYRSSKQLQLKQVISRRR